MASDAHHASWPVRLVRSPLRLVRKLVTVVPAAIEQFFADRCTQHAAAIAYRVLFSVAPLAIVLVSIFGVVLQNDELRAEVVNSIVDRLPVSSQGQQDIEDALVNLATPAGIVGVISLIGFFWAASGMMGSIRIALETVIATTRSPMVRGKLVDFILTVGAAALVLLTLVLTLVGEVVRGYVQQYTSDAVVGAGILSDLVTRGTTFVISAIVVILLYRFVPTRRLRFGDALAGAVVAATGMTLISLASSFVFNKTTELSAIYGSLTAALLFLYSVYLYASALLIGAEVAAAWSRPPTESGPPRPLRVRVRHAIRGLFVRQPPLDPPPSEAKPEATG